MIVVSLRPVGLPPPAHGRMVAARDPQWQNYVEIFRQRAHGPLPAQLAAGGAVAVPLTLLTASLAGFGLAQLRGPLAQPAGDRSPSFLLMVPPSAVWLFRYQLLSWTGLLT